VIEARGSEVLAQLIAKALVVPQHNTEQHTPALALQVATDRTPERSMHAITDPGEASTVPDKSPPISGQHDMNAVPSQPGSLVKAVARASRKLCFRAHLEDAAGRGSPAEGQLELGRLVGTKSAEALHTNRHGEVEAPPPRSCGDDYEGALGAADLGAEHAPVEAVEPEAPP
jgi:hypothetical protein